MLFRIAAFAILAASASAQERAGGSGWNYDEPEKWQLMDDSACAGQKNSPIAVVDEGCTDYHDYIMNHGDCTFADMNAVVTNNGVNLVYKEGAKCNKPHFNIPVEDEDGDRKIPEVYTHYNAHIHLSSEHTIDGKFYAAEMHMVHLRDDGTRASVVGTMIEPSRVTDHPVFEVFLNAWKKARRAVECGKCEAESPIFSETERMQPYKMLDTNSFYHYDGGLTTPPCSEIVWWNLGAEHMGISVRQFAELSDIILNTKVTTKSGTCEKITVASQSGSTSRPPQPLFGRKVQKICPTSMKPHTHPDMGPGDSHSHDHPREEYPDEREPAELTSSATCTAVGVGALSFAAAVVGQMI